MTLFWSMKPLYETSVRTPVEACTVPPALNEPPPTGEPMPAALATHWPVTATGGEPTDIEMSEKPSTSMDPTEV
ncbi:MAG: hypothetical protein EXR66_08295 [Dehalococcoidia bacterium]|nr:hypothetical protein [Dehalococcoidia bacterium]